MKELSNNWITEPSIDFEYKKYILLDYLQHVQKKLNELQLYPYTQKLIKHHLSLLQLRDKKQEMFSSFFRELKKIDLNNLRLQYKIPDSETAMLEEIEAIIDYALPQLQGMVEEVEKIRQEVRQAIEMIPIGILPMYKKEGYLFIRKNSDILVFQYAAANIEKTDHFDVASNIYTTYLTSYALSFTHTFENIKLEMIRANKALPNPATFAFSATIDLPVEQTFLPIAREYVYEFIFE